MTARGAAYAALAERVNAFPDLHRLAVDRSGLADRDARLANAIDHQATLRWLTLQSLIEPHLKQSWGGLKPVVRAALLGGSAQLLLMDRIPDHAVLNETVEWIKASSQPRAAGLVNAILRRLCDLKKDRVDNPDPDRRDIVLRSDGSGIELKRPMLSEDPDERLQQQCSCPESLLDHWMRIFDASEARRLALHGITEAPLIVTAPDTSSIDDMTEAHELPGFHVVQSGHGIRDILEACPEALVQDPASADPVRATIGLDVGCIVDLCAGRGTKTRLLAKHHPKSRVIASDIDRKLIDDLKRSTEDHANVEVRAFGTFDDLLGKVDLLVLDVPCSNTAVLARRPEARYRFTPQAVTELAGRQRQIMADALPLLSPTGKILYSTCSLDPAENHEQAQWLVKWHRFRIESERLLMPQGLPGEPGSRYHDGSYHALLGH